MKSLYNKRYFKGSRNFQKNAERVNALADAVMAHNPKNVLDVGSGLGFLVKELNHRGIAAQGIDFAETLKDDFQVEYCVVGDARNLPYSDQSFDVVVSSDFFEHIDDEDIDQVFSEMKRVGKIVLARIAFYDDITPLQARYHVSNQTKEWWEKRLPGCILI